VLFELDFIDYRKSEKLNFNAHILITWFTWKTL